MQVPMADAARLLGVSLDTVKRRVKRGELVAVQEKTSRGFRWVVVLPEAEPFAPEQEGPSEQLTRELHASDRGQFARPHGAAPADAPAASHAAPAESEHLQGLVATLQGHIDDLRGEVGTLREQLGVKDQQLEARVREISELHVLLQRAQAAALPAPTSSTSTEPSTVERMSSRPWWAFWR